MGTNKTIQICVVFMFLLPIFASCNGGKEELKMIQQDMDSLKSMFAIERSTYNALCSKSFEDFVTMSYIHKVIEPGYFDSEDFVEETPKELIEDFVTEVVDEHLTFTDTTIVELYKIQFYYERNDTIKLFAEPFPDRFNHPWWKWSISKQTMTIEIGLWDITDPREAEELPNYVTIERDTLSITVGNSLLRIPQFQNLKHHDREARLAGCRYSKCNSYDLLTHINVQIMKR